MTRQQQKSKLPADWADPRTSDDLPVDPKKLMEIRNWLKINKGKSGILVISGPTGCAKTASLRIIAKELSFDVREWITPLDRTFTSELEQGQERYQNQTTLFDDFLYSSSRYRSLFSRASSQLVLVEDYPNAFLRDPSAFHEILARYKEMGRSPAVFICTDVAERSLKLLSDLFPSSVQIKLGISHISFNCVCRTRMMTAVKRMCNILQRLQPGFTSITSGTCNDITSEANGDVRYATLALQMGLKKNNADLSLFDNPMKRQTHKPKDSESEAVKTCGKDEKVGLLRAVGRILYPKFEEDASSKKSNILGKRKRKESAPNDKAKEGFLHTPDSVADAYSSSASMFVLFLQENYLNTFSNIDSVAKAATVLSESDVMMNVEGVETPHTMSFYMALNGVMHANKIPHRSWNPLRRPQCLDMGEDLKDLSRMLPASISHLCLNTSTLMKDVVSYLPKLPNSNLTRDQKLYVESLCSMKPSASKSSWRSANTGSHVQLSQTSTKTETDDPDSKELHISDSSDSETEKDTKENNISDDDALGGDLDDNDLLAAAMAAEERIDYGAMLMDECDDDLLLASQP